MSRMHEALGSIPSTITKRKGEMIITILEASQQISGSCPASAKDRQHHAKILWPLTQPTNSQRTKARPQMPSLAPGEQQEPVTSTHKDSRLTFPQGSSGTLSGHSVLANSQAAKEKHPSDHVHKADLTEIPSPSVCDMATARSQLARPAGDIESPEAHVTLITISFIIY